MRGSLLFLVRVRVPAPTRPPLISPWLLLILCGVYWHHSGGCFVTAQGERKSWLSIFPSWHHPGWVKVGLLLQASDGVSLGCALNLCWHGGGWALIFLWYLFPVSNSFFKVFCLGRLSYSWFFGWRERLFLGFCVCVWFYRVLASPAHGPKYQREKENAGSSPVGCSSGADALSHFPFSFSF